MTESAEGEIRYLLSGGLGSIRQATDDTGAVVGYNEFDPYGNPSARSAVGGRPSPYGFTGEWWQSEVGLLHLRVRWYAPETGSFLSRDAVESEPPYLYAKGNPTNRVDPSGLAPLLGDPNAICLSISDCAKLLWAFPTAQAILVTGPAFGVMVSVPISLFAINYYFCDIGGCVVQSPVSSMPAPPAVPPIAPPYIGPTPHPLAIGVLMVAMGRCRRYLDLNRG
jgi:RHS repeat-associated protein